jgi:hypothetical protein
MRGRHGACRAAADSRGHEADSGADLGMAVAAGAVRGVVRRRWSWAQPSSLPPASRTGRRPTGPAFKGVRRVDGTRTPWAPTQSDRRALGRRSARPTVCLRCKPRSAPPPELAHDVRDGTPRLAGDEQGRRSAGSSSRCDQSETARRQPEAAAGSLAPARPAGPPPLARGASGPAGLPASPPPAPGANCAQRGPSPLRRSAAAAAARDPRAARGRPAAVARTRHGTGGRHGPRDRHPLPHVRPRDAGKARVRRSWSRRARPRRSREQLVVVERPPMAASIRATTGSRRLPWSVTRPLLAARSAIVRAPGGDHASDGSGGPFNATEPPAGERQHFEPDCATRPARLAASSGWRTPFRPGVLPPTGRAAGARHLSKAPRAVIGAPGCRQPSSARPVAPRRRPSAVEAWRHPTG